MWTHPGKLAIAFLLLGAVMYFGLSIEPREIKAPEEKMQASAFRKGLNEETLQKAMAELEPVQKAEVETLMKDLQNAASDSVRLPLLKGCPESGTITADMNYRVTTPPWSQE